MLTAYFTEYIPTDSYSVIKFSGGRGRNGVPQHVNGVPSPEVATPPGDAVRTGLVS